MVNNNQNHDDKYTQVVEQQTEIIKELDETHEEIKKEHKFNFKAWLIASIFSIVSCCIGITNMIIQCVNRK